MRCFLLAILLLFPQQPPPVTQPLYTCVYRFKHDSKDTDARIYVSVYASSEGEASIKSYRFLTDRFALKEIENLIFVEAQKRADPEK